MAGQSTQVESSISRGAILALVMIVTTALAFYLCFEVLRPFLSVLCWSLALTVISYPIFTWLRAKLNNENIAAGLMVVILALAIAIPTSLFINQLGNELSDKMQYFSDIVDEQRWRDFLESNPRAADALVWTEANLNVRQGIQDILQRASQTIPGIFRTSIWSAVQFILILFTSFFFFRDRRIVAEAVRQLIPLSREETDRIFLRVKDTIHATLYGTFVVALIQGGLAGVMFWILGLPAPVLWGMVMSGLALIPYLGASVIWAPTALWLGLNGDVGKAIVLGCWGLLIVSTVDNILKPFLIGKRLRFHTLLIFFFILGGIGFFGISGIVLGPMTLAVTDALVEIWKQRLKNHQIANA